LRQIQGCKLDYTLSLFLSRPTRKKTRASFSRSLAASSSSSPSPSPKPLRRPPLRRCGLRSPRRRFLLRTDPRLPQGNRIDRLLYLPIRSISARPSSQYAVRWDVNLPSECRHDAPTRSELTIFVYAVPLGIARASARVCPLVVRQNSLAVRSAPGSTLIMAFTCAMCLDCIGL
jgi:hypothetical protein